MNLSRRDLGSQATLVFYEFSLVPLSILATFFVLSIVGGMLVLTRAVAAWIGLSAALADGLSVLIIALACIAMVAAGGTVVYGYQRFFDRSFSALGPLPVLAVPLLGLVGSTGYALVHLQTLSPPWWVSLLIVLCAQALAFRAIALYSMLARSRASGTRAGIAAAVPATLALITLVTRHFLDASWNELGQRVAGVAAMAGGSLGLAGLVVLPVATAIGFGLYCTREGSDSRRRMDVSLPTISPRAVLERLEPLRSMVRFRSADRSTGGTDGRGPSRRARPSGAPPPSSPNTDGSQRSGTTGDTGQARSVFRGGSGKRTGESESPDRSGGPGARSGETDDRDEEDAESGQRAPASAVGSQSGDESSGTGSDTRIFTDDFGQYETAESVVETCPDCSAEIPSDGQYRYCPQCGAEL